MAIKCGITTGSTIGYALEIISFTQNYGAKDHMGYHQRQSQATILRRGDSGPIIVDGSG